MAGGLKLKGRIEGYEEMERALIELGRRTGLAAIYRVLEEVGEPIRDVMEKMAPEHHGGLKQSIKMIRASAERQRMGKSAFNRVKNTGGSEGEARSAARGTIRDLNASGSIAEVIIGPGRHPQGLWAEFGTGERFHHNGKAVGIMPAANGGVGYIRPTWDAFSRGLEADIAARLRREIEKTAKRQAARAARRAKR